MTSTIHPIGRRGTSIEPDIAVRGREAVRAELAAGFGTCGGCEPCAAGGTDAGRGICTGGAGCEAARAAGCACGYGASSEILAVGATRCSTVPNRAPQPPQKRESGALSVPQLGQRIPAIA